MTSWKEYLEPQGQNVLSDAEEKKLQLNIKNKIIYKIIYNKNINKINEKIN